MKRAIALFVALFLCRLFHTALGRGVMNSPPGASALARAHASNVRAKTSTVNLHNHRWKLVAVEVRIGDDPDPEANRSLGERTLKRGEVWTIRSRGEDVWYRSDADADQRDGRRTSWVHRPCYPNRSVTYNESL